MVVYDYPFSLTAYTGVLWR